MIYFIIFRRNIRISFSFEFMLVNINVLCKLVNWFIVLCPIFKEIYVAHGSSHLVYSTCEKLLPAINLKSAINY